MCSQNGKMVQLEMCVWVVAQLPQSKDKINEGFFREKKPSAPRTEHGTAAFF